jgi:hypothetical protein
MPVPDMSAIAAIVGSLNSAKEIAKSFVGLRDAAVIQTKVIELQTAILSAQKSAFSANAAQTALLEQVRQLKEEVARLKAWETEKQRYQLTELTPGVMAYALKEEMRAGEPTHYLCANCYQNGEKAFLQQETRTPGMARVQVCHKCGSELYVRGIRQPEHRGGPARRR